VIKGTFEPANVVISGAITSADFLPGQGGELSVAGIGGGYREYRMLIGMDAKATRMPVGSELGGSVVSTAHISKQIVAYEFKLGVASFFGGPNYTSINAGKDGREALQFSEGFMLDYVAYRLVAETFGITACQPQVEYAEGELIPHARKTETPAPKAATSAPKALPHPGARGDLGTGKQKVAESDKKSS
jgi:curli biogenesis system outer membrane secretion channel CsgG